MRKLLLLAVLGFILSTTAGAQELGVRFGNVSAGHVAIDGVYNFDKIGRVHADISFGNGGVGVDALWDFMYKPLSGESLNWYAGVGPYLRISDPFWLGVVGEIGLEYKFSKLPVSLSVDWRPGLSIIETTDFYAKGFGINVRYVFGK
jgi:hypothetical protein